MVEGIIAWLLPPLVITILIEGALAPPVLRPIRPSLYYVTAINVITNPSANLVFRCTIVPKAQGALAVLRLCLFLLELLIVLVEAGFIFALLRGAKVRWSFSTLNRTGALWMSGIVSILLNGTSAIVGFLIYWL